MNQRRVVITGIGAVTPYGTGAPVFLENIKRGVSGLKLVSAPWANDLPSKVAGAARDFDPESVLPAKECERVPRVVPMAIAAAREALEQAGLTKELEQIEKSREVGVVIGTGGGGIEFAERQYAEYYGKGNKHLTPYCISSSFVGMLSSEISISLGLRGVSHVISTGCTSSTDAMGYAFHSIRNGIEKVLVTGGAEACITRGLLAGFARMKVVSMAFNDSPERASRPFDLKRDGFVLGEGAWVFVFEEYEHALNRGAKILAEVAGYGSTCDAYHRVMASEDGVESARAMALALADAGILPGHVQYVNLHGTSTRMNDKMETVALKLAFDRCTHNLAMSATKSMIGHPQGACGAAGVMATLPALSERVIHPTINYEEEDPDCDLNYTPNHAVLRDVDYALCNTIAFGSKNSSLVLKKFKGPDKE